MSASETNVSQQHPTPLYHQIFLLYRQQIIEGRLTRGDQLPSEDELAARHNVSRITAKRAMNELARARLVTRARGRGTIVSYEGESVAMSADFSDLLASLLSIDASTEVEVISVDYVRPPTDVRHALELPEDAVTQRVERRRRRAAEPFSHSLTYLPESIGRSFSVDDLWDRPILALVEAAGCRVASGRQSVTAALADPKLSGHLETPVGAPLLQVRRVLRDVSDRPVQHITVHYRPEKYTLTMKLDRVRDGMGDRFIWAS